MLNSNMLYYKLKPVNFIVIGSYNQTTIKRQYSHTPRLQKEDLNSRRDEQWRRDFLSPPPTIQPPILPTRNWDTDSETDTNTTTDAETEARAEATAEATAEVTAETETETEREIFTLGNDTITRTVTETETDGETRTRLVTEILPRVEETALDRDSVEPRDLIITDNWLAEWNVPDSQLTRWSQRSRRQLLRDNPDCIQEEINTQAIHAMSVDGEQHLREIEDLVRLAVEVGQQVSFPFDLNIRVTNSHNSPVMVLSEAYSDETVSETNHGIGDTAVSISSENNTSNQSSNAENDSTQLNTENNNENSSNEAVNAAFFRELPFASGELVENTNSTSNSSNNEENTSNDSENENVAFSEQLPFHPCSGDVVEDPNNTENNSRKDENPNNEGHNSNQEENTSNIAGNSRQDETPSNTGNNSNQEGNSSSGSGQVSTLAPPQVYPGSIDLVRGEGNPIPEWDFSDLLD